MPDQTKKLAFDFAIRQNGEVVIFHFQKLATVLRGNSARKFLAQAETANVYDLQLVMARLTGNYKRGNERQGANHPRNRF